MSTSWNWYAPQQRFLQNILNYRPDELPSKSSAAVAEVLYQFLHQEEPATREKVPPVFGLGEVWVYFPVQRRWLSVFPEELRALVGRWDGVHITGTDKVFRADNPKQIVEMLIDKAYANLAYGRDRQKNEWVAMGETGVSFADAFFCVKQEARTLSLVALAPHHTDRTMFGFDFDAPSIPSIPSDVTSEVWSKTMLQHLKDSGAEYLHKYLSSIWRGDSEEYDNIRFLAQFAGVALLGRATDQRFMRALILQGLPGTGKSTFIKMLKGLFPEGTTSSVAPHVFFEQDRISSMACSRFNFIEELSKEPIRSDSSLREVIDGARIQVRDPYVKNYFFAPKCAHLFACNRLPNIPGADKATWRRLAIMKLNNVFRDDDEQVEDIDQMIANNEKSQLIAWALAGAMDAFYHNRYLIPKSAEAHLNAWSKESDSVSIYLAEECAEDTTGKLLITQKSSDGVKRSDIYSCYQNWCKESGYTPVSVGEFEIRAASQGVDCVKRSVKYLLVALNDAGTARLSKIEAASL
jgi:P4 family phage/plasmid primase-like protien